MNKKTKSSTDIREKLKQICFWLKDKKALNVLGLDLDGSSGVTEGIIIAGANSLRHAKGLADFVLEQCKLNRYEFLHMEGYENGIWILLDLNDVLVNIFQAGQRDIYRLEDLHPKARVVCSGTEQGAGEQ